MPFKRKSGTAAPSMSEIVSRIIFPPLLLWDGVKKIIKYSVLNSSFRPYVLVNPYFFNLASPNGWIFQHTSEGWKVILPGFLDIARFTEGAEQCLVQNLPDHLKEVPAFFQDKSSSLTLAETAMLTKLLRRVGFPSPDQASEVTDDLYSLCHLVFTNRIVRSDDGQVELGTFDILHRKETKKDHAAQRYLINFNGNNGCYQNYFHEMVAIANKLQLNVVGFNYRGTYGSSGSANSKDDLVSDGIAEVQHLLDTGISPENIYLKGHSLGGAVATFVVDHFHRLGKKINLVNDRSFSNITNVAIGLTRISVFTILLGTILYLIIKPIIKLFLLLSNWEMNAADAYAGIPAQHKTHFWCAGDEMMRRADASLHEGLSEEDKQRGVQLDKGGMTADCGNLHETPLDLLVCQYHDASKSIGLDTLKSFVDQAHEHHGKKEERRDALEEGNEDAGLGVSSSPSPSYCSSKSSLSSILYEGVLNGLSLYARSHSCGMIITPEQGSSSHSRPVAN
jgi:hypothetical protein